MRIKPVVVVGAGPVGLMCALYLARVRKLPVIIVEQQPAVGGLYASVDTPWGCVDQGVHIPQETGVSVIDDLFFDVLSKNEWQMLDGVHKDIAGNIFAGQVDFGSLYPDLRRLPREDFLASVAELFINLSPSYPDFNEAADLREYFEARFGKFCTRTVFEPIAQKIWKQPLEKMSPWAAKLVHLARVVTHNQEAAVSLKMSPALNPVIGFPEQLAVPGEIFSNRRRAMYPKRFGLKWIVDGFVRELKREGVQLLTSSVIQRVDINAGVVSAIHLNVSKGSALERKEVASVVWTSPLPHLMKLLDLAEMPMPDAPLPYRVVHLFLNQPPETGALYWLWSYDANDCLVRVSAPHAYCSDAVKNGVYPFCAEIQVSDAGMDDSAAIALAESQLRMRGLIAQSTQVLGGVVLGSIRSFFVPTIANCQTMRSQRRTIESIRPANLLIATQDLNEGIFYMPDILCAAISQLNDL